MRQNIKINDDWLFSKADLGVQGAMRTGGERVSLPHTWNAVDGQDGGNDYYRGTCWYVKKFEGPKLSEDEELWLELRGAAMTAEVYLNGKKLAHHEGGYSTFRANLTGELGEENVLAISVDNGVNERVYPQKADFTFYGGIYRDVYLIKVSRAHFALGHLGGNGLKVTPRVSAGEPDGRLSVEGWTENAPAGSRAELTVFDAEENAVATAEAEVMDNHFETELAVKNVHLWDGIKDPCLYTVGARLVAGEELDAVSVRVGFRSYFVDPEKGFFLNGRSYPLCGVARHQDRKGVGSALTPGMHREDMELIRELGANTIRLAHYQHDQYFYDLCDEAGMIVWAEIPYISRHMKEGRKNTVSQMKELIVQNYHHASIVCWGLSNEITVDGGVTEDLVENHHILNDLCHEMDETRLTTMAHVFILDPEDALVTLPDIRSYNLYYGWYVGEAEENDAWFDSFHEKHPDVAMGLSEYGADATLCYQTGTPEKGDYTEEYQAAYHEHMLKMWRERPYIWAMHVWNMFDFAADGRADGGEPGVNHKGLVSFDRKTKKDAFYIYKAYLSKEPFVHLCGRRYVDRAEGETEVKVYSNQARVTLFVDGKEFASREGDKIFRFLVPLTGEHHIEAAADTDKGRVTDSMDIRRVAEPNPAYRMEREEIVNWFDREDMQTPEGYFSIRDRIADISANPEAAALLEKINAKMVEAYGDVAKNATVPEEMRKKQEQMPLETMLKSAGNAVTAEMVVELNRKLNQIKK